MICVKFKIDCSLINLNHYNDLLGFALKVY